MTHHEPPRLRPRDSTRRHIHPSVHLSTPVPRDGYLGRYTATVAMPSWQLAASSGPQPPLFRPLRSAPLARGVYSRVRPYSLRRRELKPFPHVISYPKSDSATATVVKCSTSMSPTSTSTPASQIDRCTLR
ncbi:hypothetical protein LY76DRAFT_429496 [Colletotrichum caudatum]|nr:hypothetical protein LY76DRAFT_429496 [Colletotrichum caudatum]